MLVMPNWFLGRGNLLLEIWIVNISRSWFYEEVKRVLIFFGHNILNKITFDINLFSPFMKHNIISDVYISWIVTPIELGHSALVGKSQIFYKGLKPYYLKHNMSHSFVFSFSTWSNWNIIFFSSAKLLSFYLCRCCLEVDLLYMVCLYNLH